MNTTENQNGQVVIAGPSVAIAYLSASEQVRRPKLAMVNGFVFRLASDQLPRNAKLSAIADVNGNVVVYDEVHRLSPETVDAAVAWLRKKIDYITVEEIEVARQELASLTVEDGTEDQRLRKAVLHARVDTVLEPLVQTWGTELLDARGVVAAFLQSDTLDERVELLCRMPPWARVLCMRVRPDDTMEALPLFRQLVSNEPDQLTTS